MKKAFLKGLLPIIALCTVLAACDVSGSTTTTVSNAPVITALAADKGMSGGTPLYSNGVYATPNFNQSAINATVTDPRGLTLSYSWQLISGLGSLSTTTGVNTTFTPNVSAVSKLLLGGNPLLDPRTWTQLQSGETDSDPDGQGGTQIMTYPGRRYDSLLAMLPNKVMVVYGGTDTNPTKDTWAYVLPD